MPPEFLSVCLNFCSNGTKDFPSATRSRMEILTKENLVGAKISPTAVSRAFTPLLLSKENQVSLVRTFLSQPGSESKINRRGGWGWKNDPEKRQGEGGRGNWVLQLQWGMGDPPNGQLGPDPHLGALDANRRVANRGLVCVCAFLQVFVQFCTSLLPKWPAKQKATAGMWKSRTSTASHRKKIMEENHRYEWFCLFFYETYTQRSEHSHF